MFVRVLGGLVSRRPRESAKLGIFLSLHHDAGQILPCQQRLTTAHSSEGQVSLTLSPLWFSTRIFAGTNDVGIVLETVWSIVLEELDRVIQTSLGASFFNRIILKLY